MATQEIITPDDIKRALTVDELAEYIQDVIERVRNNDKSAKKLYAKLTELEKCDLTIDSNDEQGTLRRIFDTYHTIQEVSIELRKLLSDFLEVGDYDGINYALYYNGKRLSFDKLDISWLRVSSKGVLELQLNKITEFSQENAKKAYVDRVRDLFNDHYSVFYNAISGTYKGVLGRGGALNVGHIAEAYEAHIEEHHPREYKVLNNISKRAGSISSLESSMLTFETEAESVKYWDVHEGITNAWMHIRNSLGTQRGTVAGDVLGMQVKQGKTDSPKLRLARMNTLKQGLSNYCAILDPNTPARDVAVKIAKYISEPIAKVSSRIVDNVLDEEVNTMLKNINTATTKGNIRLN